MIEKIFDLIQSHLKNIDNIFFDNVINIVYDNSNLCN